MEYLHPNTTITLLEGYERDAAAFQEAAAAAEAAEAAEQEAAAAEAAAAEQTGPSAAAIRGATRMYTRPACAAAATAKPQQQQQQQQQQAVMPPALLGSAAERDRVRLQQQWQWTAAKAAQLRSVIEWGQAAYGDGQELQSEEISVLIWPGGQIQDFPRGTTAGQIIRLRARGAGVAARPAAAPAMAAAAAARGSEGSMVMVNNRLVHESTVLGDGDLITLTTERLNI